MCVRVNNLTEVIMLNVKYFQLLASIMRMVGHVSAGLFRCDVCSCKVNTMVFVMLLQVGKVGKVIF